MTGTMMTKPIKWATQRGSTMMNNTKASYRIHKKSHKNQKETRSRAVAILLKKEDNDLVKLEKELAFAYDTMATVTVHFESLYHAYYSSKSKLDQIKTETRLCEMEKELLTAYDDLALQVNHLGRKIEKLEKAIKQLKEEEIMSTVSSPCSSTTSSIDILSNQCTPFMNYCSFCEQQQQPYFYDQQIFNNILYM